MKKIFSFLFTFLLLIKMSKKFWNILFLMFPGGKSLFRESSLMTFIVLCMVIIITFSINKLEQKNLILFIIFLICLMVTSIISLKSNSSFAENLYILINSYLLFFVLILVYTTDINLFDKLICQKTILYYSFFQAILGIVQHFLNNTIVPVFNSEGKSIVNSIYYLNGISSNKSFFVKQVGTRIRAFGMTDSGLTFGLLMLFAISILLSHKDLIQGKIRYLFLAVYSIAIIFTLTRVIYIASLIMLFFVFSKRKAKVIKSLYFLFLFLQMLMLFGANYIYIIKKNFDITFLNSFISRLEGYKFFIDYYGFNFKNILFGFDNVSYGNFLKTIYTLDNELLNVYMDIGIVGCLMVFVLIQRVINLKTKDGSVPIDVAFIGIFTLLGIVNSVYYFFAGVAIFLRIFYGEGYKDVGEKIKS